MNNHRKQLESRNINFCQPLSAPAGKTKDRLIKAVFKKQNSEAITRTKTKESVMEGKVHSVEKHRSQNKREELEKQQSDISRKMALLFDAELTGIEKAIEDAPKSGKEYLQGVKGKDYFELRKKLAIASNELEKELQLLQKIR